MEDPVMTYFWYWMIPMSILVVGYIFWDEFLSDKVNQNMG